MKRIAFFAAMVMLVVLLAGCSTHAQVRTDNSTAKYNMTDPDRVQIFVDDKVGRDYEILGVVVYAVDAGNNASPAMRGLRRKASELGANAVINTRLEVEYGYWKAGLKATGTAVRVK